MMVLNEWEVEEMERRYYGSDIEPNMARATRALARFVTWTNDHSDGWPYWPKPSRAARRLMEDIYRAHMDCRDLTPREVTMGLRSVKAFLTRQGADAASVLGA